MALVPPNTARGGYPLGLTGATAATRFAGATTSGAPASGTFAKGDFVVDQTGVIYVCTVAGSPGTWVAIGSGGVQELAYAQITSDVSVTGTAAATPTDVVSAGAVTFDGATRVAIEFFTSSIQTGASNGASVFCNLWEDSTDLGVIAVSASASQSNQAPCHSTIYRTPASGSKTYSVKAWRSVANGIIRAASATYMPAYIRISTADSV